MPRPKSDGPTNRELEILQILWEQGASTTREVVEALNRKRHKRIVYNSVLTILTIMHDKGFVTRDETSRSHVYKAVHSKAKVENKLVQRFVNDVFGGSTMQLVSRALSTNRTSAEEAEKVQHLLEAMKGNDDTDQ